MFPPELRHAPFRNLGNVIACQADNAARGTVQSGQNIQKCGFSGSAFTHNGNVFAFLYGEIHIFQCLYLSLSLIHI